ncbi:RagB/SusD family nutrient uptake outer membrane protein [Hymenobacter rubripertinctus]|uniref:RagB/SusD family nutrient uptake outer membrane protein n=1 Tax=Hymenobacter rubripertinctus TaxID=2029981 RepID=A0A418QPX6_9BACT|nr:RagB/SusD family nutrient uptake outer membrane protein [Hymenobacter rubripertinctus]RIY07275.1 RagB/SusD family nutrient uptake outer membrane protein [Hymenobacter rubripertinctus]
MKNLFSKRLLGTAVGAVLLAGSVSCTKDLDREPFYGLNTESVYKDPQNIRDVLAKLYGGLVTTGRGTNNDGATGNPDVKADDEGASSYLRQLWVSQELPTDEAVIAWGDGAIQDLNTLKWSSNNNYNQLMYSRIFFQLTLCNEFIRETSDENLNRRGISGQDLAKVQQYRAEARFLRALSYYHALDLFGNPPFVTEADTPGKFLPEQTDRPKLFAYVESELKAVEAILPAPRQNEYGRADKAAAWTLLSRLYLNAEVYISQPRYNDAITYAKKVIDEGGYALAPSYPNLFLADNNLTSKSEMIMAVINDGVRIRSFGGTTFLVHASIGGRMNPLDYGVKEGWGGLRATKNLPLLFGNVTQSVPDKRALFFTPGQRLDINNLTSFNNGYAVTKWQNVTSDGKIGSDPGQTFADTDFPLFRLADVYLMYAEATLRGGNGDQGKALQYVNALRQRAYGNTSGNVNTLTLDFLLDERARELYWEGYRRTDLIRFKKFTGSSYIWPWKGGQAAGDGVVMEERTLYPIPSSDLGANPKLKQNPGY